MVLSQTEELLRSAAPKAAENGLQLFSGCMPFGASRTALVTITLSSPPKKQNNKSAVNKNTLFVF